MTRPADLTDEEFDLLEETIASSVKGRAFLRRFARRAAGIAGEDMRAMFSQLRDMIAERDGHFDSSQHIEILRRELMEMAASIERARREIASLRPADDDGGNNKIVSATFELDAIVTSTERASLEILNSAERLMELTGRLRRAGGDPELCADFESEITGIFTACSFQDLTGQRTSKVVNALRYIEQRVAAMISIWGIDGVRAAMDVGSDMEDSRPDAHLLAGPQRDGHGVSQDDVDRLLSAGEGFSPPQPEPMDLYQRDDVPAAPEPVAVEIAPTPPVKIDDRREDGKGPPLNQAAIDALFD